MSDEKELRKKFDVLYEAWKEAIIDPKIQLSSNPRDYIDNEPYRKIVSLGRSVLPYIIEKLEQGEFFFNQAFIDIAQANVKELVSKETPFPSEQEKSKLLLDWWKSNM